MCKQCGLPDEIVAKGAQAVGRWKVKEARKRRKQGVEVPWAGQRRGAGVSRRRKPHGRAGAVRTQYRSPAPVVPTPPTVDGTVITREL